MRHIHSSSNKRFVLLNTEFCSSDYLCWVIPLVSTGHEHTDVHGIGVDVCLQRVRAQHEAVHTEGLPQHVFYAHKYTREQLLVRTQQ